MSESTMAGDGAVWPVETSSGADGTPTPDERQNALQGAKVGDVRLAIRHTSHGWEWRVSEFGDVFGRPMWLTEESGVRLRRRSAEAKAKRVAKRIQQARRDRVEPWVTLSPGTSPQEDAH